MKKTWLAPGRALALFLSVVLSACTGTNGEGKPPMDAEIIQGAHELAFYRALNETSASVVVTEGLGHLARFYTLSGQSLSTATDISPESVEFSVDGSLITIKGRQGIYESSDVKIKDILEGLNHPPAVSIDALCKNTQNSGYDEFRVAAINHAFVFLGVSKDKKDLVGGPGRVTKTETGSTVRYQKVGFGTVSIDKSQPDPDDNFYFRGGFSLLLPLSPWNAVTDMYCHLNNIPGI